ncbi:hypothetical protein BLNAU_16610 [Blattamonas nauphoetae]|uniref:CPC1/SPEF2 domain-containing protein n=1 Tax=Blattamonas nauphoetae TaxID=2049346 RepID=A0ABQ9XDY6_9EUKA|nr:hypothetical protein BLNAU_16610 [Blattamonas nauphoetae]
MSSSPLDDIAQFEQNLQRLGVRTTTNSKKTESLLNGTPTENLQKIQQQVKETQSPNHNQTTLFLRTLKDKQVDGTQSRIEKEKRQAKQENDERQSQQNAKFASLGDELLIELLKLQIDRRTSEKTAMQKEQKKQQSELKRLTDQEAFQRRRDAEYQKAMKKFLTPTHPMELEDRRARAMIEYDRILDRKAETFSKHYDFCLPISHQLVDLAVEMSEYCGCNGVEFPPESVVSEALLKFRKGEEISISNFFD